VLLTFKNVKCYELSLLDFAPRSVIDIDSSGKFKKPGIIVKILCNAKVAAGNIAKENLLSEGLTKNRKKTIT
jgi:hypothetical protein